tara:strand:+ start:130020 stop:130904 length:885 start_codon:yes stop_codon:yes gene_type:complete
MEHTKVFEDFKRDFNFQSELSDSIAILEGGKGFRAKFIALLADIFQIAEADSDIISDATESLHTATLVHDDVIDNAQMRRGKTSLNNVIDNKKSILLGDYYLAKTIQKISELNRVELVHSISAVLSSLVEGEWLQAGITKADWSMDTYKQVAIHKTGSIFSWCLQSVLTVKFGNLENELIDKIGNDIGLLFQIVDDFLDFKGEDKTLLADLKNGNINYFLLKMKEMNLSVDEAEIKASLSKTLKIVEVEIAQLKVTILNDFIKLLKLSEVELHSQEREAKFNFFLEQLASRYKN